MRPRKLCGSGVSCRGGHCWFRSHEKRIVASCGVNAAVRRGPKCNSGFGSMSEHCRTPNSGRGSRGGGISCFCVSLNQPESLTRIRALEGALTYGCLPENQAQIPRLNRVRAITASGSGGSQSGMWCISKVFRGLGAVSARRPETDGNRCNPCRARARARCAESNKPRHHAARPRAPNRISQDRASARLPGGLG